METTRRKCAQMFAERWVALRKIAVDTFKHKGTRHLEMCPRSSVRTNLKRVIPTQERNANLSHVHDHGRHDRSSHNQLLSLAQVEKLFLSCFGSFRQ